MEWIWFAVMSIIGVAVFAFYTANTRCDCRQGGSRGVDGRGEGG